MADTFDQVTDAAATETETPISDGGGGGGGPTKRPAVRASIEPIAVDVDQAATLIGVSRSMFYELMDAGKIGPMGVKFSTKCHRFPLAELRDWAAAGMPSREQWQRMRGSAAKITNGKGS